MKRPGQTAMLRANSHLRRTLGDAGVDFLEHAAGAIQRILPHVEVGTWKEHAWSHGAATSTSAKRIEIKVTLAIGKAEDSESRSLTASVRRRCAANGGGKAKQTFDVRECDICRRVVERLSEVIRQDTSQGSEVSIQAIRDAFDEYVVAQHVEAHHNLHTPVRTILDALHTLSEQSYENKALTFGCIIDPNSADPTTSAEFPKDFLETKRYKALSDGFRTAYYISDTGKIVDFIDLDRFGKKALTEKNYYPDWAEPIARVSRSGRCGIALSRQGDILIFDEGTLRFTYRYGHWQYWNHTHLINLIRDIARAQRVPPKILGRVVGAIYRAALDVSFRRCGGLFVILHNRNKLHDIVRVGDAIGDQKRNPIDRDFDAVLQEHTIQSLPRAVAVELASLDGAVVLENSGKLLAYGAVLQPKKAGRLQGTEGSRTKAAIGASNYGLAVKISADGDISVYCRGKAFIRM
jgi:hypothetical protein